MIAALLGSVGGLTLGLTGGMGAVLTVPLLVFGLQQPVHNAVLISLFIVSSTAFFSLLSHQNRAQIDWPVAFWVMLGGSLSAVMCSQLGEQLSENTLLVLYSFLLFAIGIYVPLKEYTARSQTKMTKHQRHVVPKRLTTIRPLLFFLGIGCGALSGIMGLGAGLILVPTLRRLTKDCDEMVIPTSLLIVIPIAMVSIFTHLQQHALQGQVIILYLIGSTFGIWLSSNWLQKHKYLQAQKMLLAIFLIALSAWIGSQQLPIMSDFLLAHN
jgi:uncharacterized membrane protein YfcA